MDVLTGMAKLLFPDLRLAAYGVLNNIAQQVGLCTWCQLHSLGTWAEKQTALEIIRALWQQFGRPFLTGKVL
jgi:hypothetical protein